MEQQKEWFFESDEDKKLVIETKTYENGSKVKRVLLSTGKYAVARELLGKDMKMVDKICNGKKDDYLPALMITAVKVEDQFITLEELDEMKGKDYTSIKMLATMLNF